LQQQHNFDSWSEFYEHIQKILAPKEPSEVRDVQSPILFRGQASYGWPLQTTLERYSESSTNVLSYLRLISAAKTQIETFTEKKWAEVDDGELQFFCKSYDALTFSGIPHYEMASYMRHQGFPSPLLDWSRSPWIAAYFAFQAPKSERVAIWTYQEYAGGGKTWSSSEPRIKCMGPNVRSDPRHFLQQGEYTMAMQFIDNEWTFASHSSVFQNAPVTNDYLTKITLPASAREEFLRNLNLFNINAYSLFQSEEALMETVAYRLFHKSRR
jgi:hypothetical protein